MTPKDPERKSTEEYEALLKREHAARDAAEHAGLLNEKLQLLTAALAETLTAPDVARAIVARVPAFFGASTVAVFVPQEGTRVLQPLAFRGRDSMPELTIDGGTPLAHAIRVGEASFLDDMPAAHRRFPDLARVANGAKAAAVVPLSVSAGRTIGAIGFLFEDRRSFSKGDRELMTLVASQCAQSLDRAKLSQAAETASKAKDRFLAMLAHELRNPLTPMLAASHILQQDDAGDAIKERARMAIDRQVKHMARLIEDLLDVSRITRGSVELRRERVDLCAMLEATISDHEDVLRAEDLRFARMLPPAPVWVLGDAARLSQVVSSLLNNASKFTPAGGAIVVQLEAHREEGSATICVRDTGIGMDNDTLARVFEPFVQADTRFERGHGGLGLGLTVVKGLMDLHDGEVEVASEGLGKGTQFTVRIPLERSVGESEKPAEAIPRHVARPLSVLVIEDDADGADLLEAVLVAAGYRTRVAYTSTEGLDAAHSFNPDVVLCDLGMPGMDGFEVAKRLREDPRTAGVHLIAVTGYGSDADKARTRKAGFNDHVTKPVEPYRLQGLLSKIR